MHGQTVLSAGAPELTFSQGILSSLLPSWSLFEPRLIQTSPNEAPYWTTELGNHLLFYRGRHFMDVTATPDLGLLSSFPDEVSHAKALKPVFETISDAGPRANLEKFTSFKTRYYKSETGRQSQAWLLSTLRSMIKHVSVREFPHPWGQNSIVLTFHGRNE